MPSQTFLDKFLLVFANLPEPVEGLSIPRSNAAMDRIRRMGATIDDLTGGRQPAPTPVLDREQIDGLIAAAGVDGAREILATFWRSTESLMAALKAQLIEGDLEEAARTAHALKGSALNVGAMRLSCSARSVEDACRSADTSGALKRLDGAEAQCGGAAAAFDAVFSTAA